MTPAATRDGPGPCRIVVLRALALGDLLCAVPLLRELRRRHPRCHVALLGLPWSVAFAARFPDLVDEHLEFPGFPGIVEAAFDPAHVVADLARHQAGRWDLAVGLQGSGLASNAFLLLLGARRVAAFHPPGVPASGPGDWIPYSPHGHEIQRLLALAPALGGHEPVADGDRRPPDDRLALPMTSADWVALSAVEDAGSLVPGGYAVVHAGARDPARRWPADRFAVVARTIAATGLPVVLTGSEEEREVTAAIAAAVPDGVVDLGGRTPFGALVALVDGARLVVTNDTGISHVAAARRVRSVVVFTGSERERWAPLDAARHVAVGRGRPAGCRHDGAGPHRCLGDACLARPLAEMAAVPTTASVVEAVLRQLVASPMRA